MLCCYGATSAGQVGAEILECAAREMSFQVVFALPQLGQNEPVRAVKAGGEAIKDAPLLLLRRGHRPPCQLGNVVLITGRRIQNEFYEYHGVEPFLRRWPGRRFVVSGS